jgi:hypothetical protein
MLRAVWQKPLIHYQVVEIPVEHLKLLETAEVLVAGKRKGRQSLGAAVLYDDRALFNVFFDASDGKCAIRNLLVADCVMLREWDVKID